MDGDFHARKAVGTSAELCLRDLLTDRGALVTCNRQNRDKTHVHPGVAIARHAGTSINMPDVTAYWSSHLCPVTHFEVKAQQSDAGGVWEWDQPVYARAIRRSRLTGQPTYFAVRDLSAGPLPPAGELDDPHHWWIASITKLILTPERSSGANGRFWLWPVEVFLPLSLLLHGEFAVQPITFIPQANGRLELL